MTLEEKLQFNSLLFNHKNLWLTFQEYRYMQEHPEMDWETVHDRFSEEVDELYQALADAMHEGQPLQGKLQTILRTSDLAQYEVLKKLKKE